MERRCLQRPAGRQAAPLQSRGRGRLQRSILHEKRRKPDQERQTVIQILVSEGSSLCILAGYAGKGWSLRLRGFVSGTDFLTRNELVDSVGASLNLGTKSVTDNRE